MACNVEIPFAPHFPKKNVIHPYVANGRDVYFQCKSLSYHKLFVPELFPFESFEGKLRVPNLKMFTTKSFSDSSYLCIRFVFSSYVHHDQVLF